MKKYLKTYQAAILISSLMFISGSALAFTVNNNSGSPLEVNVDCGNDKKQTFYVNVSQTGNCTSTICAWNAQCHYDIKSREKKVCNSKIQGGLSLQVNKKKTGDGFNCAIIQG